MARKGYERVSNVIISLVVLLVVVLLYLRYSVNLGLLIGALSGLSTFFLLRASKPSRVRPFVLSVYIGIAWLALLVLVLGYWGIKTFVGWSKTHSLFYYLTGVPRAVGGALWPCSRDVPQMIMGTADYVPSAGIVIEWPTTLAAFLLVMVPYAITAIALGRGVCGWLCYLGNAIELVATCGKERLKLSGLREKAEAPSSGTVLGGLKRGVRDAKYGILLAVTLLLIGSAIPVVCLACWALWARYEVLAWALIAVLVALGVVLPILTRRRLWCIFCPVGAAVSLVDKLCPFGVKVDKSKCTQCMACLNVCPTYAIELRTIREGGSPTHDCIKCGRCIDACPVSAVDLYVKGTSFRAGKIFIPLAIVSLAAWYIWFVLLLNVILPRVI